MLADELGSVDTLGPLVCWMEEPLPPCPDELSRHKRTGDILKQIFISDESVVVHVLELRLTRSKKGR